MKYKKVKSFRNVIPGKLYKIFYCNKFDSYVIFISKSKIGYNFLCYFPEGNGYNSGPKIKEYCDFVSEGKAFTCYEME